MKAIVVYLFITLTIFQNLYSQIPVINSFSPTSGPIGTTVTITGNNFNSTPSNNIVFFGAVRATVNSAGTGFLVVVVPAGASFQPISVTVNGLMAVATKPFIVTFTSAGIGFTTSSFATKNDLIAGRGPSCTASGDLDGDGRPDIIVVNDSSNTVSVFRNISINDTISFAPKIDYATGDFPLSLAIDDLDGDGKQDLVVANGKSNTVSIFRNISSGAGNISFAQKIDLVSGSSPSCVVIRDFDGDGKQDIAAANNSSNTVSIFKNISSVGSFLFIAKSDFLTGTSPNWITVGDLDNDGKADLAVVNGVSTNAVSVLRNNSISGNISFVTKKDFDGGAYPVGITIGDMDGDSRQDLIVARVGQPTMTILLNSSSGGGNISFYTKSTYNVSSGSYAVTVNDLDGDGKPDIIVANSFLNSVSVLKNRSMQGSLSLSFSQPSVYSVGSNPWFITSVDMNGDGKPDIATANNKTANVSVLKNTMSDLVINSFSPTEGITGSTVTIEGLNFVGITGVSFGGIPAASFTVNSTTSITAVVDTGSSGNVTVTRTNASSFLPGFIFIDAPVITSFFPVVAGSGDTITISGNYFSGSSSIKFGNIPAVSYWVNSPTIIKAIVGEGASGNVAATTIAGTAVLGGFIYDNTPFINSITPTVAPTGATVVINGRHFTGTTGVTFGGIAASSFFVKSPIEINAVVGAGMSGNVTVSNAAASASFGGFTYIPPPSITSFTPIGAGPLDTVIIIGNNFIGTTAVSFGQVLANAFIVNSNTSISAVVGGGASGMIKVIANGNADSVTGFKYVSPPVPVINSFSPISGPIGTTVIISGANFSPIVSENIVYFGAVRASITSASATSITVKVPVSASFSSISVTTGKHLTAYSTQSFVVTFPENVDAFTSSSFASKIDFIKDDPNSVVIHDLNGDGKPDMIVGNSFTSASIAVYKNISSDSDFILGSKTDYDMGNNIYKISTEDIDGDGQPDLIITYGSGPYYVSVYRNVSTNNDILFASPILITTSANYKGAEIGDIDGDGKPDIATMNDAPYSFSIFRNVSTSGKIVFAEKINFPFYRGLDMAIRDLDNDKKAEVIITDNETDSVSVYRNTSSLESISFAQKINFSVGHSPRGLLIVDFNNDDKNDIALINYGDSSFSILKNLSSTGQISFTEKIDYRTMRSPGNISATDFDGDGKPDLIIGSTISSRYPGFISVFKNISSSGQIAFKTNVDYYTGGYASNPTVGDLNGDSRPDIAVANGTLNSVSVLLNKIGKVKAINLCPSLANTSISSNITGANFQWQVNTGNGYADIFNDVNYANSNTSILQLNNIPSSWYGQKFRCNVDGNYSDVFEIRFSNTWTGSLNSIWNSSSNWTCGSIPDSNTDVVINSGTIIINSNVTIRSLKVSPGVTVTVNPGFNLTVLH